MKTVDFTWRPIDTLYFGPPVSMAAGELNHGFSLFPPPPMTFQGVVRTRILAAATLKHSLDDWSRAAKAERESLIGLPDRLPDQWQLAGPFPARLGDGVEPWFPTPRFALRLPGHKPGDMPAWAHRVRSSHAVLHDISSGDERWDVGAPEQAAGECLSGWVSASNLRWLLEGHGQWAPAGFGAHLPSFVEREARTGLAIDRARGTARDGLLYALRALRMASGSGFLGSLRSPLDPSHTAALTSGLGTAGRGARPVEFEEARRLHPDWVHVRQGKHLPAKVNAKPEALFWLVTIAPARVADPWQPITAALPAGVEVVVRAALTGPLEILGGLSMVGGDSRPNRSYVPAGSSWLIEIRGGDDTTRAEAVRALHDRPSVGAAEDHPFGFGHTLIGLHP